MNRSNTLLFVKEVINIIKNNIIYKNKKVNIQFLAHLQLFFSILNKNIDNMKINIK